MTFEKPHGTNPADELKGSPSASSKVTHDPLEDLPVIHRRLAFCPGDPLKVYTRVYTGQNK